MIVLCGSSISNYYNKVKLALLEKGVPFSEEYVATGGSGEALLAQSPLAKIPFIRTAEGPLSESQAILEYLEDAFPEPPLLPREPFAAAKVRELAIYVDLHLEIVARDLYPKAFFGGTLSDGSAARIRARLERNLGAFRRLAKFAPFVAGNTFTQADCSAWCSLSVVSLATRAIYGEDLLATAGVDWKAYSQQVMQRPSAQRVAADRKAAQAALTTKS
jgi:glutathione S-transferase